LPERDVQRADAAADGRRERSFDADQIFLERRNGVVRQPVVEFVLGGSPAKTSNQAILRFAAVGLLHRGVEHPHTGCPDVRAGAVATDERAEWDCPAR